MSSTAMGDAVRILPLSYNNADSRTSALRLLFSLLPSWETQEGEIKLTRFTDGITNTLLKATKLRPGLTDIELDREAVLIRAFGKKTEIIIDREREAQSHLLLAQRNLAPRLLARFQNGLMYHFIRGSVCTASDLRLEPVWRGVAQRLGEWHAVLPVPDSAAEPVAGAEVPASVAALPETNHAARLMGCGPNMWTTLQKWVRALPDGSAAEKDRKVELQRQLERCVAQVGSVNGIGRNGLVMSHCDLLSGNVIVEPREAAERTTPAQAAAPGGGAETVSFIDYEYTTPAPAAFDLANHLAEWGGFECDYATLPTRSVRRAFVLEYLASFHAHRGEPGPGAAEADDLCAAIDAFRGVPGLYWGVWAVIQDMISQIDFDYASYAEKRLSEWYVPAGDADAALRERRWAEE